MLQEYFEKIRGWARERNIIDGCTPKDQFVKLVEEWGETVAAIADNENYDDFYDVIIDGIGDCVVVLTIMSEQLGDDSFGENIVSFKRRIKKETARTIALLAHALARGEKMNALAAIDGLLDCMNSLALKNDTSLEVCVATAWESIKDRKGKIVDGIYIKEE